MSTTSPWVSMAPRRIVRSVAATTVAGAFAAASLIPLFWVLAASVKDRAEVRRNPLGWPEAINWQNYPDAWIAGNFARFFMNSVLVVVPTVAAVLVLSLITAYAFALMPFRFKRLLYAVLLVGMMVPIGVLVIPLYYQMLSLGLLNTLWSLILPQAAIGIPISTLILRSFIEDLPSEVLEAARVDGCGDWTLLRHMVFPLCRAPLLALLVLQFMWVWNQFLLPLVLTQRQSARTLPFALNAFLGQYSTDVPLLMAAATITFVPVLVVYVVFQRSFVRGMTAGALK